MIVLQFQGWVSCRLATNPDPYDDPRGTRSSFKQFAYAGEPDLDRIIRFNNAPFRRSYTYTIGVTAQKIILHGKAVSKHPLLGAKISLIDDPVFEGRNVVIANDAREPIYPFHCSIESDDFEIRRKKSPVDKSYPYPEYLPYRYGGGLQVPGLPDEFKNIDHSQTYTNRLRKLRADLTLAKDEEKPGIAERVSVLETQQGSSSNFAYAMAWKLPLTDPPVVVRGDASKTGIDLDSSDDWEMHFWFGAHDQDGQAFYCVGELSLPSKV